MKKILPVLLICLFTLSLFACGKNKTIPAVETEAVIYGDGVIPAVVVSAGIPETAETEITALRDTIAARVGSSPRYGKESEIEKTGVEIVIGDTSRAITARAKEYLPAYAGDDVAGCAICFGADGAAFVWNHEAGAAAGIKYFKDAYTAGGELRIYPGTYYVGGVSVYDYEQEREAERVEQLEAAWAARFDVVEDPDVREAVRSFYEGIYDPEKLIRWWAGLYDPDRGGFYYANSARDHEGFLPDMESTYQILNRTRDFVPDLKGFLGEELTQKIVTFYQDKQDPEDGYFYHPQWTKAESRSNVMRYSRDQDWALFVLGWLGAEPLYPTALDRAAETAESGGSTTSYDWQPNVQSVTSYVNDLLATASCESWANTLETQATTFQATGMLDTVIDVLDSRISPEYGVWVSGYDEATDTYYNLRSTPGTETPYGIFTNAYKVAKMYNIAGRHIPYTDKTVANAIKAICSRDPGVRVTYLFNPWATLGNVRQNLVDYGTPAEVAAYDAQIKEHIVEMVDALGTSLALYRSSDGSYSYLQSGSKPTIYDTPVSLGVKEGDVNGNNLVMLCATHICTAIGLPDMIPIFSELHADLMLELLKNAPSIRKSPTIVGNVYDFSSDTLGSLPVGASENKKDGTTFPVVREPGNTSNKVLSIDKNTEGNDNGGQVYLPLLTLDKMTDTTVLEVGMRINVTSETRYGRSISGSNPNIVQIGLTCESNPFWMPTLRFNDNATGYTFLVVKSTSGGAKEYPDNRAKTFALDTWYDFTFRITIKNFGKSNAQFRVEILVDGEYFGESECFYSGSFSDDSVTSGSIGFKTGKSIRLRFQPQMRIHSLILVDDVRATVTETAN